MDLDKIIEDFLTIEDAIVGRGYLHPNNPDISIKQMTEEFINKFSFLQRDRAYIEFLRKYSGAHIGDLDPSMDPAWTASIFGFHFDWMYYRFQDEYTIDDHIDSEGYLGFCHSLFEDESIGGISYYFNQTQL